MTINNRAKYLGEPAVGEFIKWAYPLLDTPGAFIHEYRSRRPIVDFRCVSIYDAYRKYFWTAGFDGPDGRYYSGKGKEDNENDVDLCLRTCVAIQDWGGTKMQNIDNINRIGRDIVNYLRDIQERLNPDSIELGRWQDRDIFIKCTL